MDWLAIGMTKVYEVLRYLPRWMVYIATGAAGSVIINLLHWRDGRKAAAKALKEKKERQAAEKKEAETSAPVTQSKASGSSTSVDKPPTATPTGKGKKKGGKK